MKAKSGIKIFFSVMWICVVFFTSCSKKDSVVTPVADPCAGKNIVITANPSSANPCTGGSIVATAAGSAAFTYKLNSTGTYQATGTFNNVSAGTHTLFAKDGDGCETSVTVTVQAIGAVGSLFKEVKGLLAAKCQSCHNAAIANGGMNWELECNIIANKARIKARAVDEGTMPPTGSLSQTDKDKITNWINAGGGYGN